MSNERTQKPNFRKFENLVFYRAKNDGNGCAVQIQMRDNTHNENPDVPEKYKKFLCHMQTSSQKDGTDVKNATFNWQDESQCINIKIEPVDIGQILAVINRQVESVKIYHDNEGKDNKIIEFSRFVYEDKKTKQSIPKYRMTVSCKSYQTNAQIRHSLTLNVEDAMIMKTILEHCLLRMYKLCR